MENNKRKSHLLPNLTTQVHLGTKDSLIKTPRSIKNQTKDETK